MIRQKISLILFCLFFSIKGLAQKDSLYPSWIKQDYNYVYFQDSSHLKNSCRLMGDKGKSLTVLHIGDSHLQNENLPNQSRKLLQAIQGDAGIGLIVPFSTVKSYDARFYKSTHTGTWKYSKSYMGKFDYPMGVRGMTSYTSDSNATFKISFSQSVSSANNELVVFRHDNDSVFEMEFYIDDQPASIKYLDNEKVIYNVVGGFSVLSYKAIKTQVYQKDITITGMILQDSLHRGGIWHNAGVGAAPYKMVLSEEFYEPQAKFINPDLVIIDLGTNDFLYFNRLEPELRQQIIKVIEKVKNANPTADIILTDAQEMKYIGKRTTVANQFSEMIYNLAIQYNAGFWSYYTVAGGKNAWRFWDAAKYTQGDGIHLNGVGSELKGALLFHAIENSVTLIKSNHIVSKPFEIIFDSLVSYEIDSLIADSSTTANINAVHETEKTVVKQNKTSKNHKKESASSFYVVKKNDTLGGIALKTKVPIAKIRKLNKLKSDLIKPGQKLKLK
jgi:LysM repeat protein/lysophospholipase L1-like esterase